MLADSLIQLNDAARLAALRRTALLDSDAEEAFDRLTRLAARLLKTPIALVSLVDDHRQFFKSAVGLPEPWATQRETPLTHSFCKVVVGSAQPLIVTDAREDARVHDHPAVLDLGVIAYVGIPLITSDGFVIGSFSVIDTQPRQWTGEELDILRELAASVMNEVELRQALSQLEAADTALQQRAEEAEAARQQSAAMLNRITDGFCALDRDWRIVYLNQAAVDVMPKLGKQAQDLLGKSHWEAFPDLLGTVVETEYRRAVAEQVTVWFELYYAAFDTWFEVRAYPSPDGLSVFFQDVTERKRQFEELASQREEAQALSEEYQALNEELGAANEELRLQSGELEAFALEIEAVHQISSTLAAELDLGKLLQSLTDAATQVSGAEFGAFFYNVVNPQGEAYMLYTLSGAPREAFAHFPLPRNTAIFAPTFAGEGAVRLADVTRDPRYGQNSPYHGMPEGHLPVRSYLAIPVSSRSGEVLGGLFFGHGQPGVFTARHERMLTAIASQAAIAIDNARLYDQARYREEQLRSLTDALPALISYVDREYRYRLVNQAYESWFGKSQEELQGRTARELMGESAWEQVQPYTEIALAGRRTGFELTLPHRELGLRTLSVEYTPHIDSTGVVQGVFVLGTDITTTKRAEDAQRFLAEASRLLGSSLEYETTLKSVARLAVPRLADWCAIDIVNETGDVQRLAVEHIDPAKIALAFELPRRYPPAADAPHGMAKVIRTGESEFFPVIPPSMLEAVAQDEGHLDLLRGLGLRSMIIVPLNARGQTFGALALVSAESGRVFSEEDLSLAHDLAERAAVAIENARLYRKVEEAGRSKDQFLAMLAHELRNPLGAASNALQVMSRTRPADPAYQRAREVALRQIHHQARLVDDLLDVSRIQRGKIDLRRERLDLVQVIRETAEDQRSVLEGAGLALIVDLPGEPLPVEGDSTRLGQVLANLLDNARKFTPAGGQVQVRLAASREASLAELTVRDTGVGITPEMLHRIFDPFTQAEASLDRTSGGLGLGLALVKGLVALHGGKVTVYSGGHGQGTEFRLQFPLQPGGMKHAEATRVTEPKRRELRVLVIEDMADAAETMRDLLELLGYEVEIALSGSEGVEVARRIRPDVVLCDLGLPGMSGYEVAAALRSHPATSRTCLVALTGYGTEEDRRKTREAGFHLHLTKPIQPEQLQQALAEMAAALYFEGAP